MKQRKYLLKTVSMTVIALMMSLTTALAIPAPPTPPVPPVPSVPGLSVSSADDEDELTAYSDTTSAMTDSTESDESMFDEGNLFSSDRGASWSDLEKSGLIAIAIVLFVFVIFPVLILFLIFWMWWRTRNRKLKIMEKAVENGQPLPGETVSRVMNDPQEGSDIWQRGIKHASIGAGLAIFGALVSSTTLMGIGAVIACYGAGQAYIGKKEERKLLEDRRSELPGKDGHDTDRTGSDTDSATKTAE